MTGGNMNKRYIVSRRWLLFWTLFIGIGAVAGATGMLADTSGKAMGMDAMLPYFQVLPFADVLFQNFLFSGIALLIVNGLTNLTAAALLFARRKSGIVLGGVFGITLMAWIVIQFVIFPLNFMSTIYFVFGILQAVTGYVCYVGYMQSNFRFDPSDYHNVGTDHTKLVVYFSRCGYTRKVAYGIANDSGAELLEVTTTERTQGNLGFWWCGRFAMHRWGMPIAEPQVDLAGYDHVTIVTPVWDFAVCAPIREFCTKYACGKLKSVDYVSVHFMRAKFDFVADSLDEMLQTKRTAYRSVSSHFGNFRDCN